MTTESEDDRGRQAGDSSDEILVTPEMIEAGAEFLWDGDAPAYKDRDEILISIYRAMEKARLCRREGDG
jgi:hypothetical protein